VIAALTALRVRLCLAIFVGLSSVYLLTYSGSIESSDTWFLFNGIGSLVHFGDWGQDLTADEKYPTPDTVAPDSRYPIRNLIDDPLSVVLATPLYWLADKLTGVGLVHAVWLFNVFLTAAAGCVLFAYTLTLGYNERVGAAAALAFGVGTIVWAYSKTFFQENLTLLVTLSLALALERWRKSRYRSWRALLMALVFALCLPFAKWTSIIAIPSLLLIALPTLIKHESRLDKAWRWIELALFLALISFLVLLAYTGLGRVLPGIDWFNAHIFYVTIYPQYIRPAMHSYLFSIGASVWGTSPILLLALPGAWLLYRQRRTRYLWVALLIVTAYALGYALLRGVHWFSGLSWPPRFLVPTVPFLLLVALPAIDRILNRQAADSADPPKRHRTRRASLATVLTRGGFAALLVYGVWVQLSALSFQWGVYPALLPPDTGVAWGGGMNTVRYLRWVLLPREWGRLPLDFAWVRMDQPLWAAMFAALAVVSAAWLIRALTAKAQRWGEANEKIRSFIKTVMSYALLPFALLACVYLGLRLIYADPQFYAYNTALFEMLPIVEAQTQAGDVVLLTGREHRQFLLNYGTSERWRGIGISYLPGERYDPNGAALVTIDNLINPSSQALLPLLPENTPWLIDQLATQHPRLWVWADFGPDMAWTVRPLERYLTRLFYPVREFRTAPSVRLLEYDTTPAPIHHDTTTSFIYDNAIQLVGFALPRGTDYAVGDTLLISLFWRAQADIGEDYTVALFLAHDGGVIAQGMDSAPDGGFSRTSLWTSGVTVQDNRALRLPVDMAAGAYQLWIVLYGFDSNYTPQRLTVTGGETREETIAVLPVSIVVR
jgi:hypothetical protein